MPHIANEILDQLNCTTKNLWPSINRNFLDEIKFAVQVNGKTRDIITIKKELNQKQIEKIITADSKAKKFIQDKKIEKIIFVKDKIINFIIIRKLIFISIYYLYFTG